MMVLNYKTSKDQVVDVKIGLSYTSIDNAKLNLEKEAADLTFDEAKDLAKKRWNDALNRIEIFIVHPDARAVVAFFGNDCERAAVCHIQPEDRIFIGLLEH